MNVSRRGFLAAGLSGMAGAAAGSVLAQHSPAAGATPATDQPFASYLAVDLATRTPSETDDLLRALTDRITTLHRTTTPNNRSIATAPADPGTLGPTVAPGRLTTNIGYGASFFDRWHTDRRPRGLTPMREFPDDGLDRDRCDGDLLLEIRAGESDEVSYAVRELLRAGRGGMTVRWQQEGTVPPPRPAGAPRNHLGFKDGTANLTAEDFPTHVWLDGTEQPWTRGGTFVVVRLIRMLTEFWDRISVTEQEQIFGRDRGTGAPLDGSVETDVPHYADDPTGDVIPLTSHIRKANPRTADSDASRIFRRTYNYSAGVLPDGELDLGLIFTCLQRDIAGQFETVQERLAGEPLVDYITPFGGGYFYLPPREPGMDASTIGGLL